MRAVTARHFLVTLALAVAVAASLINTRLPKSDCELYSAAACDPANPALEAFRAIEIHQNTHCRKRHFLVINNTVLRGGLGSRMSIYKACLAFAMDQDRIYADWSCEGSGECNERFTRPWTSCSRRDIRLAHREGRVKFHQNSKQCTHSNIFRAPSSIKSAVVWSAAATAYLLRPSFALAARVAVELKRFPSGRPDLAVHVRRCDKVFVEAFPHSLAEYAAAVPQSLYSLMSLNKNLSVHLVTDDAFVYSEIPAHIEMPGAQSGGEDATVGSSDSRTQVASVGGPRPVSSSTSHHWFRGEELAFKHWGMVLRDPTAEVLRSCRWCADELREAGEEDIKGDKHFVKNGVPPETVGGYSASMVKSQKLRMCMDRHEERALIDLHVLSNARVSSLTWSSNYGMLVTDLQQFRSGFCAPMFPVDNSLSVFDFTWAYLTSRDIVFQKQRERAIMRTAIVRMRCLERNSTAEILTPTAVSADAIDPRERSDPWNHSTFRACPLLLDSNWWEKSEGPTNRMREAQPRHYGLGTRPRHTASAHDFEAADGPPPRPSHEPLL